MLFTTLFSLLVLVEAAGPNMGPTIPVLHAPSSSVSHPIPTMPDKPWAPSEFSPDLVTQLTFGGQNAADAGIDTEQQQQYVSELSALGQEIKQEAEEVADVKKKERENQQDIKQEGENLMELHNQQTTMSSLRNAAASVANKILLSDYSWNSAVNQAARSEAYLGTQESGVVGVLSQGEAILDAAKGQIEDLDENGKRQVQALKEDCVDPLYAWNFNATKDLNQQIVGLADVMKRVDELMTNFELAHDKTVDLMGILHTKEQDVPASLLETHAAAKAMLAQPRIPLNPMKGVGLDQVGFWPKLKVLKTLFEHSYGDVLEPFEALEKKLHDA